MGLNFRENPEELFQGTSSSTSIRKKNIFIKYVHTKNIDFFLPVLCMSKNK